MATEIVRYNRVQIRLTPNLYYTQLDSAEYEKQFLKPVDITPLQIQEVKIFKSYATHVTDVTVKFNNLDTTVASRWSEGKYLTILEITSDGGDQSNGLSNVFVCDELTITESNVVSTLELVEGIVKLKSITRMRLEYENNIPFELGGRGSSAAASGMTPLKFLETELETLYARTYEPKGSTYTPWDMTFTDTVEPKHQTTGTPAGGFKMDVPSNFLALDFFFKHYPIFNTTYDWLLDDFNIMNAGIPTMLKITDMVWYKSWQLHENIAFSNIINNEVPDTGGLPSVQEFRTASALRHYQIHVLQRIPYWEWVSFEIVNGFPKIWAVDVSTNKPIPMNHWNSLHLRAPVMDPLGGIKIIENPMWREYLTFMPPKEIEQTQLYKVLFESMHPEMHTYRLSNMLVGEVDLHTVVKYKKDRMAIDEHYDYDRWGVGYQVLHTFTRKQLSMETNQSKTAGGEGNPNQSKYANRYVLDTEIVLLVVDEKELDINLPGSEESSKVQEVPSDFSPLAVDACASYGDSTGGISGKGIPGNTSIADQGQAMIDNGGFRYVYGGTNDKAMDCSAFTQKAVTRAGIGDYPRDTAHQLPWCERHATKIDSVENAKRGDIVFFSYNKKKRVSHTGIALGPNQYLHASSTAGRGTTGNFSAHNRPSYIFRLNTQPSNTPKTPSNGGPK